jgi:hypothetical protein
MSWGELWKSVRIVSQRAIYRGVLYSPIVVRHIIRGVIVFMVMRDEV